jgi:hypothetical protein
METIDNHYYESFAQIGQAFYDWERHIINLGCNTSDFDLNQEKELTQEGKNKSSKFIHEYIHYLQNFATSWGTPVFIDFALAVMKIGASSATSDEKISLPIDKNEITNKLLLDGIELRESVILRMNKCNNWNFNAGELKPIFNVTDSDECAKLSNNRINAELGIKLIREHMAHLGTQLYLKKSDQEIHNYNESIFTKQGSTFSRDPEYWILFEYVFETEAFSEIARGLFHLMQNNLITLNPEKTLRRFVTWFEKNKSSFKNGIKFIDVVETWLMKNNEGSYLYVGLSESEKHCEKILTLTQKHQSSNDLFLFVSNITEYALKNLRKNKGGRFLFNPNDDFSDIDFWKRKVHEYGTGILRYLDNVIIQGTKEHTEKMTESFYFLLSTSLVLKRIFENHKGNCPFLDEIPICKAEIRESENCYRNPYLMVFPENKKQCLFGNGILFTGMNERLG